MSRRILFFALATSATLIATQASADRECFEDSCRNFEPAEPATSSLPPPAADESAAAEANAPAVVSGPETSAAMDASAAAPTLTPARALPQVVETPQVAPVKTMVPPAARPPVQNFADHEPAKLAPRSLKPAPAPQPAPVPVRVTNAAAEYDVRTEAAVPPAAPPAVYRAHRAAAPAPAVVAVGGASYAEDDVVRVYPNPRHDPAWKVCQLDSRESDQRRCGAYSYHPFGANGYRPNGVYAPERGTQIYMMAPNAKIISIDSDY
jgi:hypothetical protein